MLYISSESSRYKDGKAYVDKFREKQSHLNTGAMANMVKLETVWGAMLDI